MPTVDCAADRFLSRVSSLTAAPMTTTRALAPLMTPKPLRIEPADEIESPCGPLSLDGSAAESPSDSGGGASFGDVSTIADASPSDASNGLNVAAGASSDGDGDGDDEEEEVDSERRGAGAKTAISFCATAVDAKTWPFPPATPPPGTRSPRSGKRCRPRWIPSPPTTPPTTTATGGVRGYPGRPRRRTRASTMNVNARCGGAFAS